MFVPAVKDGGMEISMKDLSEIILSHALKYPQMQPQDAVLLIYESEYGPGSLIGDGADSRLELKSMYEKAVKCAGDFKYAGGGIITEPAGSGYVRIYLKSIPEEMFGKIQDAYMASMAESAGSHYYLTPKLYELIDLKAQGNFAFTMEELEDFLMEYEALDYPKPEHSSEYVKKYDVNYCIVAGKHLKDVFD